MTRKSQQSGSSDPSDGNFSNCCWGPSPCLKEVFQPCFMADFKEVFQPCFMADSKEVFQPCFMADFKEQMFLCFSFFKCL